MTRTRTLVASSIVGVAAQGVGRLLTNIALGRLGGPSILGEVSTISAVCFMASLAGPTPMAAAASKFAALHAAHEDTRRSLQTLAFSVSAVLGLIVGLWVWAGSGVSDGLAAAFLAFGAGTYPIVRALCLVDGRAGRGVSGDLISATLGLVGTVCLVLLGMRGGILLLPQAFGLVTYVAYVGSFKFSKPRLRTEIVEFILLAMMGGLTSAGVMQLVVLVGRIDGGSQFAGSVTAAISMATPLSFLAAAITSAIYPRLSAAIVARDSVTARTLADTSSRHIFRVLTPVFAALGLFARDVMQLVWTAQFQSAGQLVAPAMAAVLGTAVAAPVVALLTASSRRGVRQSAVASVGGTLIGFVFWGLALLRQGAQPLLVGYGFMLCFGVTAVAAVACVPRLRVKTVLRVLAAMAIVLLAQGCVEFPIALRIAAASILFLVTLREALRPFALPHRLTKAARASAARRPS